MSPLSSVSVKGFRFLIRTRDPNHRRESKERSQMNMKFAASAALVTLAFAAYAPQAAAADNGFYLGAGVSQATTKLSFEGLGSDDVDDTGFKVIAGWRPLDFFAVEANYVDMGGDSEAGT